MSYKKFSSAQDAPSKDSPDDKSKAAPAAVQPATQPDKKPAEGAPARKSQQLERRGLGPPPSPLNSTVRPPTSKHPMTLRTIKKTVTFRRPFVLGGFDEVQPAGAYSVETDEELLEGISFPAYRRILTVIQLHEKAGEACVTQTLTIDPNDLDAALKRDQTPAEMPADTDAGVSAGPHAQWKGQVVDAESFLRLEPDLDEVMSDPIVRLVMRRDGLTDAEVWDAIKTVRAYLAARSGQKRRRQAIEGSKDKGMIA